MKLNEYILTTRVWFEGRSVREKLLVLFLSWAFLYLFFYFFAFRDIDKEEVNELNKVKKLLTQLESWNNQIAAITKLANSPLYQKWMKQHQSYKNIQGQYRYLLRGGGVKQWQDIMKVILQPQPNITVIQIKNLPETSFGGNTTSTPNGNKTTEKIYQQPLSLSIYSNFFDTYNYIKKLEQILPNVYWNSVNYQVVQYPVAKVEMEFSILYEKE